MNGVFRPRRVHRRTTPTVRVAFWFSWRLAEHPPAWFRTVPKHYSTWRTESHDCRRTNAPNPVVLLVGFSVFLVSYEHRMYIHTYVCMAACVFYDTRHLRANGVTDIFVCVGCCGHIVSHGSHLHDLSSQFHRARHSRYTLEDLSTGFVPEKYCEPPPLITHARQFRCSTHRWAWNAQFNATIQLLVQCHNRIKFGHGNVMQITTYDNYVGSIKLWWANHIKIHSHMASSCLQTCYSLMSHVLCYARGALDTILQHTQHRSRQQFAENSEYPTTEAKKFAPSKSNKQSRHNQCDGRRSAHWTADKCFVHSSTHSEYTTQNIYSGNSIWVIRRRCGLFRLAGKNARTCGKKHPLHPGSIYDGRSSVHIARFESHK